MKMTHLGRRSANFSDGTCWPLPDEGGDSDRPNLRWLLLYGDPTPSDLMAAASVISAYDKLLTLSLQRRSEVIRAIKSAHAYRASLEGAVAIEVVSENSDQTEVKDGSST